MVDKKTGTLMDYLPRDLYGNIISHKQFIKQTEPKEPEVSTWEQNAQQGFGYPQRIKPISDEHFPEPPSKKKYKKGEVRRFPA
jgi:hypothetical protein